MKEASKIMFFKGLNRLFLKPIFGPPWPYSIQRAWFKLMASVMLLPKNISITPIEMASIPAEVVTPKHLSTSANDEDNGLKKVILYLHGGAYCICTPKTHRSLTCNLAKKTQAMVFVPDYRLAPEHPFPAGIDDCLTSYQWLLSQGFNSHNITLAGDSAGGGLVMATALKIRELNLPAPTALVLISPWSDLTLSSLHSVSDKIDPLLRWSNLQAGVKAYLQGQDPSLPLASSSLADLSELPPMLIQVGSEEIILNDSKKLHQQAMKYQNDCRLSIYENGWHVFQLQAGLLDMSDKAIEEIDQFISKCIQNSNAPNQMTKQ